MYLLPLVELARDPAHTPFFSLVSVAVRVAVCVAVLRPS